VAGCGAYNFRGTAETSGAAAEIAASDRRGLGEGSCCPASTIASRSPRRPPFIEVGTCCRRLTSRSSRRLAVSTETALHRGWATSRIEVDEAGQLAVSRSAPFIVSWDRSRLFVRRLPSRNLRGDRLHRGDARDRLPPRSGASRSRGLRGDRPSSRFGRGVRAHRAEGGSRSPRGPPFIEGSTSWAGTGTARLAVSRGPPFIEGRSRPGSSASRHLAVSMETALH